MREDDDFARSSADARDLAATQLRALFRALRPAADLQIVEPIDPLALFATVRTAQGRFVAQVAAHADGASVLVGEAGALCPLDGGTPHERALLIRGAVSAALAVYDVPTQPAAAPEPPRATRMTLRPGDLFAAPWDDDDPGDQTYRVAEVVAVGEEGIEVWAYADLFARPPAAVDPAGLRRVKLHESAGGPLSVPWSEFETWHAVPVRRR